MRRLVSVVIPCYNAASFVAEAVASALGQTYPDVEVIVADDGSTDDLAAALKPFGDRIQLVRQPRQGVAAARNLAIHAGRGEFVAFLDADDVWLPDKLERQLACLDASPNAAVTHANAFYWDAAHDRRTIRPTPCRRLLGRCYRELFYGNQIVTSTVLVRRTCLDEVGAFDASILGASIEDYDLWLRLARRFAFAFLDEPLVLYRVHANNSSANRRHMWRAEAELLDQTLAHDPALRAQLPAEAIRFRYARLWCGVGYESIDADDYRGAHDAFGRALRREWTNTRLWTLWLTTLLPPPALRWFRAVTRRRAPA